MNWSDEVVDEVRKARDAYAAQFDYDLKRLFEDLRKKEEQESLPFADLEPVTPRKQPAETKIRIARSAKPAYRAASARSMLAIFFFANSACSRFGFKSIICWNCVRAAAKSPRSPFCCPSRA